MNIYRIPSQDRYGFRVAECECGRTVRMTPEQAHELTQIFHFDARRHRVRKWLIRHLESSLS